MLLSVGAVLTLAPLWKTQIQAAMRCPDEQRQHQQDTPGMEARGWRTKGRRGARHPIHPRLFHLCAETQESDPEGINCPPEDQRHEQEESALANNKNLRTAWRCSLPG